MQAPRVYFETKAPHYDSVVNTYILEHWLDKYRKNGYEIAGFRDTFLLEELQPGDIYISYAYSLKTLIVSVFVRANKGRAVWNQLRRFNLAPATKPWQCWKTDSLQKRAYDAVHAQGFPVVLPPKEVVVVAEQMVDEKI